MRRLILPVAGALLTIACSSTSGVDGKLAINSLSPSDWQRYCSWFNGEVKGIIGKSCPDGSLLPNPQLDCMSKNPATNCPANVAQVEDCVRKFTQNACMGLTKVTATCTNFGPGCNVLFAGSNIIN